MTMDVADKSYLEKMGAVASKSFGIGWGFDCTGVSVPKLMAAEVEPDAIWPYISGNDGIAWTEAQIQHFAGARVYRVNQGISQGPAEALNGDEFDMETGAWTLDHLLVIVAARRRVSWSTRIYCTWNNYGYIKEALARAGTGGSVFFRIADWNLDQHLADLELHADVYAGQWASSSSNPATLVPGTRLALGDAEADLSVVLRMSTGWEG